VVFVYRRTNEFMNKEHGFAGRRLRPSMRARAAHTVARGVGTAAATVVPAISEDDLPAALPADALDDRIAIAGTAGSGKTYAAKGFVERLLDSGARVAIVDPPRRVVGIARERRRHRGRLSRRGVRQQTRRCVDYRRDGRRAWQAHRQRRSCLRHRSLRARQ